MKHGGLWEMKKNGLRWDLTLVWLKTNGTLLIGALFQTFAVMERFYNGNNYILWPSLHTIWPCKSRGRLVVCWLQVDIPGRLVECYWNPLAELRFWNSSRILWESPVLKMNLEIRFVCASQHLRYDNVDERIWCVNCGQVANNFDRDRKAYKKHNVLGPKMSLIWKRAPIWVRWRYNFGAIQALHVSIQKIDSWTGGVQIAVAISAVCCLNIAVTTGMLVRITILLTEGNTMKTDTLDTLDDYAYYHLLSYWASAKRLTC